MKVSQVHAGEFQMATTMVQIRYFKIFMMTIELNGPLYHVLKLLLLLDKLCFMASEVTVQCQFCHSLRSAMHNMMITMH